jgi:hydroxymethylbilane synthase
MTRPNDAPLRVGTRGSRLALWQAERVAGVLSARYPGLAVEIVPIESHGDRHDAQSVADLGVTGIFTREIELALLQDEVDVAVHSLKDMPTQGPPRLEVAAVLPRDDPRDVLVAAAFASGGISNPADPIQSLPHGARVATSSLRRQAELLRQRPDLQVAELRGNVPTRIAKVERGEVDAVVLSLSGLDRLGLQPAGRAPIDPELMLPAPAQGTIAIQVRSGDARAMSLVHPLDDPFTRACTTAERLLMADLEGGCRVPLGALATVETGHLTLRARLHSPDGTRMIEDFASGPMMDYPAIAAGLAAALRVQGADEILAALRNAGC